MPSYKIREIVIDFPFEAYECQLRYMEKVIESLQNKCHALLESPTGTGKTLCLLCATLAWRKSLGSSSTTEDRRNRENSPTDPNEPTSQSGGRGGGGDFPTIVYTSRTHSQLRQVIKELKRSSYRPKMMVLGSREQLCVNEEVNSLRGKALTNACHHLCKKRLPSQCDHFSRIPDFLKHNPQIGNEPIDIEDLVNIGKGSGPCPYYLTRELHKEVDILFAPYNYLISNAYRKYLKVNWNNSVLIFDEAHNLDSLCADAASFDLSSVLLSACISEAQECAELAAARRDSFSNLPVNPDNFAILEGLLVKLQELILKVPIPESAEGFTKPGSYIYEMLHGLNITHQTAPEVIGKVEEAVVLLEDEKQRTGRTNAGSKLEIIADMLNLIFREEGSSHADCYRVHVQEIEQNSTNFMYSRKSKVSRTLSWWCLNPGITMQNIAKKGVRSVILTSGTLSPLDEMAGELKLDFHVRLENPHVISPNQLWAGVARYGPKGIDLNSSFRNRNSLKYIEDLGNAIVNYSQVIPDGLLIFFPSYNFMDRCISFWRDTRPDVSTTIWEEICKHKRPVIEPRDSFTFAAAMQDFAEKLQDRSTSGAVFFAICRGKVSEGLDFADRAGRAVVITGLPYARTNDLRVILKREYLDEQVQLQSANDESRRSTLLSGSAWYEQEAARAVNQAIGRVIRHSHDYGAIILCDSRFRNYSQQSHISLWIRPNVKCFCKHEDLISDLAQFFRTVESSLPSRLVSELANNIVSTHLPMKSPMEVPTPASGNINVNNVGNTRIDLSRPEAIPPTNQALSLQRNRTDTTKLTILPRSVKIPLVVKRDAAQACSSRKAKLVELSDHETTETPVERRCDVVNLESDNHENPNSETSSFNSMELIRKRKGPMILEDTSFRNNKENPSSSTLFQANDGEAHSYKEASPSTYLSQAQGKLNVGEYKKFIGYMQGLQKKEMKLMNVMPSIVQMFSGPERHHLLMGFKDFVPVKHRPMYEQCIKRREEEKPGRDK